MTDPLSLGLLASTAAVEGIKFLYGQAADLLKEWRVRKREGAAEPTGAPLEVPIRASAALDGTPTDQVVDVTVLEREGAALATLIGTLAPYAQDLADINPNDALLAEQVGQVRAILEAAYGQRLTFHGEIRDATGTRVKVRQVLGSVRGSVIGAKANALGGADLDIAQQATSVDSGGSLTGFEGTIES